ncbi:hypothetical protein TBLA_0I01270 [Henningerozyma blattae CBS 6284]|uniref:ATPase synthesis protein 25 n=1 Tax=Henningerozyma blattae (strain ATCC 34711 / CBS 6284 / DSM 70876 / NBRC 10599 / NRRL Y-10934 / UCD 77-7) TaxID=1071380 RepID=I2H8T5_HENB6|nr:hypothetical protein TBLA_0I01270 [Tetrapisispora blattae CBS 6284]CCH62787.1 hypothetical protein TBLA_0I01270 [Tetrapisispora blattae CBS 6284]
MNHIKLVGTRLPISANNYIFIRSLADRTHYRRYSTDKSLQKQEPKIATCAESKGETNINTVEFKKKEDRFTPWYLKLGNLGDDGKLEVARNRVDNVNTRNIIKYPKDSPNSLVEICKYLDEKLELSNILIFDMQSQIGGYNNPNIDTYTRYMIICSGKSNKHCHEVSELIRRFIKNNFSISPYIEGMVNATQVRRDIRRLNRNPRLSKRSSLSSQLNNKNEDWILIDSKVDGIFINVLTKERREIMNLEELYAPENEKFKYLPDNNEDPGLLSNSLDSNLTGLAKIAFQNRRYSTISINKDKAISQSLFEQQLRKLLFSGKTTTAKLLIHNQTYLSKKSILEIFLQIVYSMKSDKLASNIALLQIFDSICGNEASQFENERLIFVKVLSLIQGGLLGINFFIKNYIEWKVLHFKDFKITDSLFTDYLKVFNMCIQSIKSTPSIEKSNIRSELEKINNVTMNLIQNYNIGLSRESSLLIINNMYIDQDIKLATVHSMVDLLVQDITENSTVLTPLDRESQLKEIFNILFAIKSWNRIFYLWNHLSPKNVGDLDRRDWSWFIQKIVDTNDPNIIQKFAIEDMLWLVRFKTNGTISADRILVEQIEKLYSKLDSDKVNDYSFIKKYILSV